MHTYTYGSIGLKKINQIYENYLPEKKRKTLIIQMHSSSLDPNHTYMGMEVKFVTSVRRKSHSICSSASCKRKLG